MRTQKKDSKLHPPPFVHHDFSAQVESIMMVAPAGPPAGRSLALGCRNWHRRAAWASEARAQPVTVDSSFRIENILTWRRVFAVALISTIVRRLGRRTVTSHWSDGHARPGCPGVSSFRVGPKTPGQLQCVKFESIMVRALATALVVPGLVLLGSRQSESVVSRAG